MRGRVLMTADTVGGVWTYALELARALAGHGVEIALATMGAPLSPPQRLQLRPLGHVELFESAFKLEWMPEPWEDVRRAGDWLLEIERRFHPDVIHLNGYAHAALPWAAPVLVAGHSCVLSWWRAVKGEAAPPEWNRYRQEVARGLRAAALVIAPTRAMLNALRSEYPGAVGRSCVIGNGRSAALFRPAFKDRFVLTAGRLWDEAKNVRALEAAAARLACPIYVAGESGHRFRRLWSLGRLDEPELARWYARAAVYALPARYEPFGLSVLEAALSACALVLGDIPSLRENWAGAAVFVAPEDSEALADAISGLMAEPRRCAGLGAAARTRALHFSPQRMGEAYLGCYRELAFAEARCA